MSRCGGCATVVCMVRIRHPLLVVLLGALAASGVSMVHAQASAPPPGLTYVFSLRAELAAPVAGELGA